MNLKKKIVASGMSLLVLCGTLTTAYAYTYVNGTSYQTVTHKDVPAFGQIHYDTYYGSKKTDTAQFATFYKTRGDALLGNFGGLIDSSKKLKSQIVGLATNDPELASELSCTKGTIYFSAAASSSLEPSNSCDVTVKFSANKLK
ncbi:MAG: hypothetical protein ACLUVC_13765 [Longibaculum sp.]